MTARSAGLDGLIRCSALHGKKLKKNKLLRCHGMSDDSPKHVYKAIVLSELL